MNIIGWWPSGVQSRHKVFDSLPEAQRVAAYLRKYSHVMVYLWRLDG